jgi:uncharacterized protein YfaS (alpha-2-macroglobulin family)
MTVGSPSLLLRETYISELGAASSDLLEGVNPQLLEGTGTVAVTVSNTRLSSLRESVSYLRQYPYGCVEQTVSALVPWLVGAELRHVLPEVTREEEQAAIAAGIEKIFSMQTSTGGLSMWPGGDRPSLFPSAYAAVALATLAKQGRELPAGWAQLITYLSESLRDLAKAEDEMALADRTMALLALAMAEEPQPAYHAELFRRRALLSHETRAVLALAIMESGGPAAMVEELLNVKKPAPESFSHFGGAARDRAIQLMAWSRHKPRSAEVGRLTKELLQHRRNGHWGSTQDNAWALLALARYYTAAERGSGPVQGELIAGGKAEPFHVTKAAPAQVTMLTFEPQKPLTTLAVRNPQKRPLFGEATFLVAPPLGQQPRQDRGFAVSRAFQKIGDDGSLQAAGELQVGDRVLVTLRVECSRAAHFVAIDDPLPSIFEAVNPSFRTQAVGGEAPAPDWVSDHREIRSDRVLIFCDSLPAGAFTFRYLARVRSAGTVTAPSTKVEEMYRPERFGLAESVQLVSRAR